MPRAPGCKKTLVSTRMTGNMFRLRNLNLNLYFLTGRSLASQEIIIIVNSLGFSLEVWLGHVWTCLSLNHGMETLEYTDIAIVFCLHTHIYTNCIFCIYSYYHFLVHYFYIDWSSLNNDNLRSIRYPLVFTAPACADRILMKIPHPPMRRQKSKRWAKSKWAWKPNFEITLPPIILVPWKMRVYLQ